MCNCRFGLVAAQNRRWLRVGVAFGGGPGQGPLTNPLYANAKAAFSCFECQIAVDLAGQVGVKSGCVHWRSGVSCRTSLLIVRFVVRRLKMGVRLHVIK